MVSRLFNCGDSPYVGSPSVQLAMAKHIATFFPVENRLPDDILASAIFVSSSWLVNQQPQLGTGIHNMAIRLDQCVKVTLLN